LVLRFSAVGDVLLTAGVLTALKRAWPNTRIVYVTKLGLVPLVADHPAVDAVVGLAPGESLGAFRARLKHQAPDAVLDLHDKLRSQWLRLTVGAARKAVWHKRPFWAGLCARLGLSRYRATSLIAERYHDAVEQLVGAKVEPGPLSYHPNEASRGRVAALLAEFKLDSSTPVIGMAPGSMWETKRWPPEHFAALARFARAQGYQVLLSGSQPEAVVTRAVAEASGAIDLAGRVSLADLGAFIERCRAFVANDSGPMHLARALGVPTLALFGSTDPGQFDFKGHALLYANLECSPCSLYGRRTCPKGHFRCMRELDDGRAQQALQRLLEGPARLPLVRG